MLDKNISLNNFINSLSIQNFRNHENFEIITKKPSVVIYGKNGVGKTSILEALSIFTNGKGLRNSKLIEMIKLGIVVYIIYLIWENKLLEDIAAARFVVSERGDILSPKYAPEIIAPATNPSEIPSTWPIPIRAIPTVAIVDHELPEAKDTIAQIQHDAIKKYSGFKICNP